MKNKYIIMLFILTAIIGCNSGVSPEQNILNNQKSELTTLSARLTNEKFLLTIPNPFFDQDNLDFSNPTDIDTIITRRILLEEPLIAQYSLVELDSGNRRTDFFILLNPGDSINFSLENGLYLNTDKANMNKILSSGKTSSYYKFDNDPDRFGKGKYDDADFKDFYTRLNQAANSEKSRIENLFKNKENSQKDLLLQKYFSDVIYYSNLFSYIGKKKELSNYLLKVYEQETNKALGLFTNQNAVLTTKLAPIFFGILRMKLRIKNEDYSDYRLLYQEALKTDFGSFKPGLLFRFLKFPGVTDSFSKKVLNQISVQYPNSIYVKHALEISNKNNQLSEIKPLDTLTDLLHNRTSWTSFIGKSDKYVLVDYWASWCAPCRALFPLIDSVKKQFISKNIEFVSVNIDSDSSDWKIASRAESKYLKINNFYLLQNRKAPLLKKYEIKSIPRIMLFKNGEIVSGDFVLPSEPGFIDELKKVLED